MNLEELVQFPLYPSGKWVELLSDLYFLEDDGVDLELAKLMMRAHMALSEENDWVRMNSLKIEKAVVAARQEMD